MISKMTNFYFLRKSIFMYVPMYRISAGIRKKLKRYKKIFENI